MGTYHIKDLHRFSGDVIYADGSVVMGDGSDITDAGAGVFGFSALNGEVQSGTEVCGFARVDLNQYPRPNSQRAELFAAAAAVSMVSEGSPALIRTDSSYVVQVMTKYMARWTATLATDPDQWANASGRIVKNGDLLAVILRQLQRLTPSSYPRWEHVKGHSREAANVFADALARRSVRQTQLEPSDGLVLWDATDIDWWASAGFSRKWAGKHLRLWRDATGTNAPGGLLKGKDHAQ